MTSMRLARFSILVLKASSALNKAVPDGALEIDRRSVALDRGPGTWVDLAGFRSYLAELREHDHSPDDVCHACRVPLTEAAELYRGDFLAGFTLRDSPDFDDWQLAQTRQPEIWKLTEW